MQNRQGLLYKVEIMLRRTKCQALLLRCTIYFVQMSHEPRKAALSDVRIPDFFVSEPFRETNIGQTWRKRR
jgi:hypothetical protein